MALMGFIFVIAVIHLLKRVARMSCNKGAIYCRIALLAFFILLVFTPVIYYLVNSQCPTWANGLYSKIDNV